MQWFLACFFMVIILVSIGFLTGGLLISSLPARMKPSARAFLIVPLGWSVLALVATLFGWFGSGYAGSHCISITGLLTAAGAWFGRDCLRCAAGDYVRVVIFAGFASFPILGSLLRIGSFSLYNDTFFYCGQAMWLQHHGFLMTATTDGGHPAWSTVSMMQDAHLRMGAPFLLGWIQSIFGIDLPYEVFPAVAALGVICGALGVGATVIATCPGCWLEAWLTALATAVTMNGFPFGAAHGFLPQTWGIAFAAVAFGLRGIEISTHAHRSRRGLLVTGVPLGLCVAASMHCYWDLLPLEAPAIACTYFFPWPSRNERAWKAICRQASIPLLTCLLCVNLVFLQDSMVL